MKSKNASGARGFTIIELIVIVAVLSILSAIAVLAFSGIIQKARVAADNENLSRLNSATLYYGKAEDITTSDVFAGIMDDAGRMQQLIAAGYLGEIAIPQQKDVEFVWDVSSQKWVASGTATSVSASITSILQSGSASSVSSSASGISSGGASGSSSISLSGGISGSSSSGSSSSSQPGTIAATKVTLNRTSLTLTSAMKQTTLVATVLPSGANQAVTWSSSNTKTATVDSNGVVRFIKPGNTVITATSADGGKKASCTVKTQW